ncbi:urease accessory protein UreE [Brevibacillus ruminantium]|uniref:Urease accessory protein UreE n=1 Tax=Brevibacillus ruminantium TaxID=2950604 RepID=A0ABY4WN56_9BACL|nr:urease accessory protein UreE [Brevibacillus ruminantium]USG68508.1 urease accessory protein UreE [Brevibacillus ruminantium]
MEEILSDWENLHADDRHNRHVEKVFLRSDDLVKRVQRVVTDHGRELGISLRESRDLTDGDVLYMDDESLIVIEVIPEDLLVISPRSMQEMGEIAHKLGNRHLPAQFHENRMFVQYDYLVEETLAEASIPYEREKVKVKKAFRHVGHSHG